MKRIATLVLAVSLLGSSGCKSQAYVQHPGAINTFDSQTYDILISTKAVIDQTKTDLANGAWSATVASKVRTVLNTGLVPAYNALDVAYQAYHTAANPSGSTASVQAAISNVQTATASLTSAKAGQ